MCYCILYYGVGKLKFKISVPVSACMYMCTCTNTNTNVYEGDACTCKIDESPLLLTCVVMTIQVERGEHLEEGTTGEYNVQCAMCNEW